MISKPSRADRDPWGLTKFLNAALPDEVVRQISGNATREVKEIVVKWLAVFTPENGFGSFISSPKVTEVSIVENPQEPEQMQGIVVCEMDVTESMLNGAGTLHEGCIVYLIDECSTLALSALNLAEGGNSDAGVSQSINTVFHSPGILGAKLRIVNTSVTFGNEMMSSRSEIWDASNHRLVASGVHLKMYPSSPKARL